MPTVNLHQNLRQTNWQVPTAPPVLPPEEVHVWRFSLRVDENEFTALSRRLSAEERQRFARFRFSTDRAAHSVARGRLRETLSAYLGVKPADLRLRTQALGKPYLRDYPDFHFNLSHAGNWAIIALSRNMDIGADVEETDRSFRTENLVERYFSRMEVPVILSLPEDQRHRAFFHAWTRKEAIIKARGDGLSLPLNAFGVSILPEDSVRLLHTDWSENEYKDWQLRSFTVAPDVPGAVAWKGDDRTVRFFELPGR